MKKLLTLTLVLILSLGLLLGCSDANDEQNPNNGEEVEKVQLEIWVYEEFFKDREDSAIQKSTDKFIEENPQYEITFIPTPYGSSSYRDKYIQAAMGGTGPDIILSDNIWVPQFAAMEIITPIDDLIGSAKGDFFDGTIEAATFQDKLYGVPFHTDVMVLFYNKDRFEEAGLDPDKPPTTWEEFSEYANKLTSGDNYGYGLLGGWSGSFEWLPWFWQNGGEILDPSGEKAAFNSPEGIEATEFFLDMLTDDGVTPEAAKTWKSWDELTAGFSTGTVGMVQGMDVMLQKLDALEVEFNWGVAPLPTRKEQAATLGGGHFVISKDTKDVEAAYKWIEFITSSDNLPMMDEYMRTSARKDSNTQDIIINDPRKQVFYEALLNQARPRPTIPEWTQIDYDTIQPAFMRIIHEGADVTEEMNKAAEIVNTQILNQ